MNILAIDPGCHDSAWILFEAKTENVLHYGFEPNEIILESIVKDKLGSDLMAIESIEGFGMTAGQELFDTCFWSGRFCQAYGVKFQRIGRKAIKLHLCGVTSAKDKDIRESLIYRYGAPGVKKAPGRLYGISGHCWSALAVAVFASDKAKEGRL